MMKRQSLPFLIVPFALGCIQAHAKSLCKGPRATMHSARTVLKDCNKAWADSLRGEAVDPADDCAAKQGAYVAAVKEYKACLKAEKTKK